MTNDELRFGFGANWQSYVDTVLDRQRIAAAAQGLQRMLGCEHLSGKTFLDIGCGSGLSSLAACLLGAERVIGFDYDRDSVQASLVLRARAGITEDRWRIFEGSILDADLVAQLEPADIVYSWGVLHHTGAMWRAIDNTAGLVQPGGLLAIAIYNKTGALLNNSAMWWQIKRFYNQSSPLMRYTLEAGYLAAFVGRSLATMHDPIALIQNYGVRGMEFWHDVRDWLGGFPYEYATASEIFAYVHGRGLNLEYLNTSDGNGCNEFTFRRS